MDRLRVVLAQTNPRLGDVHHNLDDHLEVASAARGESADLVVFPELSVTGYFLKDQVWEVAQTLDSDVLVRLAEASRELSIVAGFVERSPEGRLYNSLGFFDRGRLAGVHRKVHLVSYGMFDEARDFAAGDSFEAFDGERAKLGPLLCEDMWHAPSAYVHFLEDVDALVCSSASPARGVEGSADSSEGLASQRTWELLIRAQALLYRTWVVYVGRVGWEDGIGFGGASCVVDPYGNVVAALDALEPGTLTVEIDRATLHRARVETPLRRDEKPWVLAGALTKHLPGWTAPETPGADG